MKLFLIFLCMTVSLLEAQQVEDSLLNSYFQASLYPVDANLGELYSPLKASRGAIALQAISRDFWESLLVDDELNNEFISPYSKELLTRQFANFLKREKSSEDTLRSILAGETKIISDTARITSKLIFENDMSLLATLYFQHSRTLPASFTDEDTTAPMSNWYIEAVDFDLNNAEKLVDGYSYDPRSTSFLERVR